MPGHSLGWGAWATQRRIAVTGELATLVGDRGIQRGTVVTVGGDVGAGVTSVAISLLAASTAAGDWVGLVDDGTFGGRAALAAGVALERCAVVRSVPSDRWSVVVGALLDGLSMVCVAAPPRLAIGDARRLQARARERQSVLLVLESVPGQRCGVWPAEVSARFMVAMMNGDRQISVTMNGMTRRTHEDRHLRLAQAG